jgi:hypothetical protein
MPVEHANRAVGSAPIAPHEVVVPPCATQFVQQRHAPFAAHVFTREQQFIFVHAVQGGSLAIGAQSTPPELDDIAASYTRAAVRGEATPRAACVAFSRRCSS